jgi:hypothetical protein
MPSTPAQPWMPVTAFAPPVTGSSVPTPSPYPKITVPERVIVAEKLTGSVFSARIGQAQILALRYSTTNASSPLTLVAAVKTPPPGANSTGLST